MNQTTFVNPEHFLLTPCPGADIATLEQAFDPAEIYVVRHLDYGVRSLEPITGGKFVMAVYSPDMRVYACNVATDYGFQVESVDGYSERLYSVA